MKRRILFSAWTLAIALSFQMSGCATAEPPGSLAARFFDILNRYPQTREPLKLRKLDAASFPSLQRGAAASDVFIMVHPAYSLFFRDANRSRYAEAKYALLAQQFENEARFIAGAAQAGKIVVLIIPGNYLTESAAPLAYTAYLNATASAGQAVFYLSSESPSNGAISMDDMVDLYRFLQGAKGGKALIGGGYIGRCQREFYTGLTNYFDKSSTFIVPEISTISPEDISESEAANILAGIQRQDYTPVRQFIDKRLNRAANILSIPQKREL